MLRAQRAARASWLELDEPARRALQIRRPNMEHIDDWKGTFKEGVGIAALPKMRQIASTVVTGWRGFTEADLLGEAIGASSEQPFSREVFAEWISDEVEVLAKVVDRATTMFNDYVEKKAAAEKN